MEPSDTLYTLALALLEKEAKEKRTPAGEGALSTAGGLAAGGGVIAAPTYRKALSKNLDAEKKLLRIERKMGKSITFKPYRKFFNHKVTRVSRYTPARLEALKGAGRKILGKRFALAALPLAAGVGTASLISKYFNRKGSKDK